MVAFTLLAVAATALLVRAERTGAASRLWAKPLASAGFIAVAVVGEAAETPYGRWVLVALVLSAVGDVALLSRSTPAFVGGLGSFLLAHLAYVAAFVVRDVEAVPTVAAAVLLVVPALLVGRWLLPSVPAPLRAPVVAYIVVISAMVSAAVGTVAQELSGLIILGAVAFYVSDLFVARDRFVAPGFGNRLWGLPLYYAAQLAFAWSVS